MSTKLPNGNSLVSAYTKLCALGLRHKLTHTFDTHTDGKLFAAWTLADSELPNH
jgi:hypothetical protein